MLLLGALIVAGLHFLSASSTKSKITWKVNSRVGDLSVKVLSKEPFILSLDLPAQRERKKTPIAPRHLPVTQQSRIKRHLTEEITLPAEVREKRCSRQQRQLQLNQLMDMTSRNGGTNQGMKRSAQNYPLVRQPSHQKQSPSLRLVKPQLNLPSYNKLQLNLQSAKAQQEQLRSALHNKALELYNDHVTKLQQITSGTYNKKLLPQIVSNNMKPSALETGLLRLPPVSSTSSFNVEQSHSSPSTSFNLASSYPNFNSNKVASDFQIMKQDISIPEIQQANGLADVQRQRGTYAYFPGPDTGVNAIKSSPSDISGSQSAIVDAERSFLANNNAVGQSTDDHRQFSDRKPSLQTKRQSLSSTVNFPKVLPAELGDRSDIHQTNPTSNSYVSSPNPYFLQGASPAVSTHQPKPAIAYLPGSDAAVNTIEAYPSDIGGSQTAMNDAERSLLTKNNAVGQLMSEQPSAGDLRQFSAQNPTFQTMGQQSPSSPEVLPAKLGDRPIPADHLVVPASISDVSPNAYFLQRASPAVSTHQHKPAIAYLPGSDATVNAIEAYPSDIGGSWSTADDAERSLITKNNAVEQQLSENTSIDDLRQLFDQKPSFQTREQLHNSDLALPNVLLGEQDDNSIPANQPTDPTSAASPSSYFLQGASPTVSTYQHKPAVAYLPELDAGSLIAHPSDIRGSQTAMTDAERSLLVKNNAVGQLMSQQPSSDDWQFPAQNPSFQAMGQQSLSSPEVLPAKLGDRPIPVDHLVVPASISNMSPNANFLQRLSPAVSTYQQEPIPYSQGIGLNSANGLQHELNESGLQNGAELNSHISNDNEEQSQLTMRRQIFPEPSYKVMSPKSGTLKTSEDHPSHTSTKNVIALFASMPFKDYVHQSQNEVPTNLGYASSPMGQAIENTRYNTLAKFQNEVQQKKTYKNQEIVPGSELSQTIEPYSKRENAAQWLPRTLMRIPNDQESEEEHKAVHDNLTLRKPLTPTSLQNDIEKSLKNIEKEKDNQEPTKPPTAGEDKPETIVLSKNDFKQDDPVNLAWVLEKTPPHKIKAENLIPTKMPAPLLDEIPWKTEDKISETSVEKVKEFEPARKTLQQPSEPSTVNENLEEAQSMSQSGKAREEITEDFQKKFYETLSPHQITHPVSKDPAENDSGNVVVNYLLHAIFPDQQASEHSLENHANGSESNFTDIIPEKAQGEIQWQLLNHLNKSVDQAEQASHLVSDNNVLPPTNSDDLLQNKALVPVRLVNKSAPFFNKAEAEEHSGQDLGTVPAVLLSLIPQATANNSREDSENDRWNKNGVRNINNTDAVHSESTKEQLPNSSFLLNSPERKEKENYSDQAISLVGIDTISAFVERTTESATFANTSFIDSDMGKNTEQTQNLSRNENYLQSKMDELWKEMANSQYELSENPFQLKIDEVMPLDNGSNTWTLVHEPQNVFANSLSDLTENPEKDGLASSENDSDTWTLVNEPNNAVPNAQYVLPAGENLALELRTGDYAPKEPEQKAARSINKYKDTSDLRNVESHMSDSLKNEGGISIVANNDEEKNTESSNLIPTLTEEEPVPPMPLIWASAENFPGKLLLESNGRQNPADDAEGKTDAQTEGGASVEENRAVPPYGHMLKLLRENIEKALMNELRGTSLTSEMSNNTITEEGLINNTQASALSDTAFDLPLESRIHDAPENSTGSTVIGEEKPKSDLVEVENGESLNPPEALKSLRNINKVYETGDGSKSTLETKKNEASKMQADVMAKYQQILNELKEKIEKRKPLPGVLHDFQDLEMDKSAKKGLPNTTTNAQTDDEQRKEAMFHGNPNFTNQIPKNVEGDELISADPVESISADPAESNASENTGSAWNHENVYYGDKSSEEAYADLAKSAEEYQESPDYSDFDSQGEDYDYEQQQPPHPPLWNFPAIMTPFLEGMSPNNTQNSLKNEEVTIEDEQSAGKRVRAKEIEKPVLEVTDNQGNSSTELKPLSKEVQMENYPGRTKLEEKSKIGDRAKALENSHAPLSLNKKSVQKNENSVKATLGRHLGGATLERQKLKEKPRKYFSPLSGRNFPIGNPESLRSEPYFPPGFVPIITADGRYIAVPPEFLLPPTGYGPASDLVMSQNHEQMPWAIPVDEGTSGCSCSKAAHFMRPQFLPSNVLRAPQATSHEKPCGCSLSKEKTENLKLVNKKEKSKISTNDIVKAKGSMKTNLGAGKDPHTSCSCGHQHLEESCAEETLRATKGDSDEANKYNLLSQFILWLKDGVKKPDDIK